MKRILLSTIALIFLILPSWASAKDLELAPAAIQITSEVSDGKYSIKDIVSIAKKNGIKVVIITDRDLMKWEYGAKPLENIVRKVSENGSIFRYGIERYLKEIDDVQRANPDMVIIGGIESAPYYHWTGHIIHNNLTIRQWHKHIMAIGMDKAQDIERIPVIGNRRGLEKPYSLKSLWVFLLPVLVIILGILAANRRGYEYIDNLGRRYPVPRCIRCMIVGSCLILAGILFLLNNYPYKEYKFDQYGKNAGVAPYQNYIDYVGQHGGLTFWSHPEAENIGKEGRVFIDTREHTSYILEANDYTGFAIFYEGYEKVGLPGGVWDEYLSEYCRGERNRPIWAIGGLSFEGNRDLKTVIKDLKTVLLVPSLSRGAALDAIKNGSMYVARGNRSGDFALENFSISDLSSGEEATQGQEVRISGAPTIKIKGDFHIGEKEPCSIKIIRNGILIDSFDADTPFDIPYEGRATGAGSKLDYYRLEIRSRGLHLITNPIFVRHSSVGENR